MTFQVVCPAPRGGSRSASQPRASATPATVSAAAEQPRRQCGASLIPERSRIRIWRASPLPCPGTIAGHAGGAAEASRERHGKHHWPTDANCSAGPGPVPPSPVRTTQCVSARRDTSGAETIASFRMPIQDRWWRDVDAVALNREVVTGAGSRPIRAARPPTRRHRARFRDLRADRPRAGAGPSRCAPASTGRSNGRGRTCSPAPARCVSR
jgi:hypothetical protein